MQVRPGLDADLLDQGLARLAIGIERLRLPAGAIESEHPLSVEAFVQGLLRDQLLEPPDHVGVVPGVELGVDLELERPLVQLLEPAYLNCGEGLGGDVGERGPAPELERSPGGAVGPGGTRLLARGLLHELREAQGIHRLLGHAQLVAPSAGHDLRLGGAIRERPAQP